MKNMKLLVALSMGVAFLFTSCGSSSENIDKKSNAEVIELLKNENVVMIDVREPDELEKLAYDVEGIINIPLSDFTNHLSEIPKDKTIIVACRSGNRSMKAAKILEENGYKHIVNLDGGIMAWENAGFGVVQKKSCCSDPTSDNCAADGTCKK